MNKPNSEKKVYMLGFCFDNARPQYTRTIKVIKMLQILGYDSSKIIGKGFYIGDCDFPYENILKGRILALMECDEIIINKKDTPTKYEEYEKTTAETFKIHQLSYDELMIAVANQTVDRYTSLCLKNNLQTIEYNDFLMSFCGVCPFYKECELHIPNKNCRMMLAKEKLNNENER